jgi:rRNA maturation endonuclease Nob1
MGLFEEAGRRFEQFKQDAAAAAADTAEYGCTACETPLHTDHETCPECGADAVVALDREPDTETGEADGGDTTEDTGETED